MGNSFNSKVEGQGKVLFKITSETELILNDVMHAIEICKNLVSSSRLVKKLSGSVFSFDCASSSKQVYWAWVLERFGFQRPPSS